MIEYVTINGRGSTRKDLFENTDRGAEEYFGPSMISGQKRFRRYRADVEVLYISQGGVESFTFIGRVVYEEWPETEVNRKEKQNPYRDALRG